MPIAAANIERWRDLYRGLIARGWVRAMPVERITDVLSDLVYGTMFTNYFTGPRKPPAEQAQDIIDIIFHGILADPERKRRRRPGLTYPGKRRHTGAASGAAGLPAITSRCS